MPETKIPTYLRAVRSLEITDYPLGGSRRGVARYWVETTQRGERIARETEQRPGSGTFNKPKKTKYGRKCAILIDENDRTYAAMVTNDFEMITVFDSALKYNVESLYPGANESQRERFNAIRRMIETAE